MLKIYSRMQRKNFKKTFVAIVFRLFFVGERQLYWLPTQEVALKIIDQTEYNFDYVASIDVVAHLENYDLRVIHPK